MNSSSERNRVAISVARNMKYLMGFSSSATCQNNSSFDLNEMQCWKKKYLLESFLNNNEILIL